ncbi:DNA-binding response regulator [Clostridia bacterium]|nr:DNA-binding response regulator [Clostridia bacterium]
MEKILVVDDDKNICDILQLGLMTSGYGVIQSYDGEDALKKNADYKPNLIVLDVMLPKKNGWDVCREVRRTSNVPIIMLTSKGEIFDKVLGLELGADDYMTKPFDTSEVIARVKAAIRRSVIIPDGDKRNEKVISYEGMTIDMVRYELRLNGDRRETPPKELELLFYLASKPNNVFTRDQLLDDVWGFEFYGDSRTVDVHIKRLRDKLDGISDKWQLKTVWGVGYKFEFFED